MPREAEVIGPIPKGLRLIFYVTGGAVDGPKCKGSIVAVGGDWLTIRANGVGVLDVREDDALIHIAYSDIPAFVSKDIAAGTASVATLDRKGAVPCNRHRSRLGFPCGPGRLC